MRADDPLTGLVRYAMLPLGVEPLNDLHCRRAVQYAVDRAAVQSAYGGPAAGDIATTKLPPTVIGHRASDRYPHDLTRARQELRACGHPAGFTTGLAVRADRPGDIAATGAVSRALGAVGISVRTTKLSPFRWGATAGSPAYVHSHHLGIVLDSWVANYPTGYGFPAPITGDVSKTGNHNMMELHDPVVKRLLATGRKTTDPNRRANTWSAADRQLMEDAALVPLIDERTVLYRPDSLRDVYLHPAYGMYDLAALGR
jgi:peptide/nickel transport system substrate-binding protein